METPNKLFQVSLRTFLEITAAVAFFLALAYQRAENNNGRYQLTVQDTGGNVYITDTATGQVWMAGTNGWHKWGATPPK